MRSVVLLVLVGLAACGPRPRVAVRTPAHTVDDRVEMAFECTRPKRIGRCEPRDPLCRTAVKMVPAPCPPRSLTMRSDTGAVVHTTISSDGGVSAVVPDPGAPPRTWEVEADGLPIGTTHTKSYRHVTVLLDLAAIVAVGIGVRAADENEDGAPAFYGALALYAFATPLAHAVNGNGRQAVWSVAARLAGPAITWLAFEWPCEEKSTDTYTCAETHSRPFAFLSLAAAPVLMAWDTWRAEIRAGLPLVEPTVSADGDKTVFGVAGRF